MLCIDRSIYYRDWAIETINWFISIALCAILSMIRVCVSVLFLRMGKPQNLSFVYGCMFILCRSLSRVCSMCASLSACLSLYLSLSLGVCASLLSLCVSVHLYLFLCLSMYMYRAMYQGYQASLASYTFYLLHNESHRSIDRSTIRYDTTHHTTNKVSSQQWCILIYNI